MMHIFHFSANLCFSLIVEIYCNSPILIAYSITQQHQEGKAFWIFVSTATINSMHTGNMKSLSILTVCKLSLLASCIFCLYSTILFSSIIMQSMFEATEPKLGTYWIKSDFLTSAKPDPSGGYYAKIFMLLLVFLKVIKARAILLWGIWNNKACTLPGF